MFILRSVALVIVEVEEGDKLSSHLFCDLQNMVYICTHMFVKPKMVVSRLRLRVKQSVASVGALLIFKTV